MLTDEQKTCLHEIAYKTIEHGLMTGQTEKINLTDYDKELQHKRATFVTLNKQGELRGCIGILQALRPLVEDVAHNAYAAAFNDNRFQPVTQDELDDLELHISILTTPAEMAFSSEQDLLDQLHPGQDGIILEDENARATFLPSVWDSISDKKQFLKHLKLKAGLAANYWSDTIRIQRYKVESF